MGRVLMLLVFCGIFHASDALAQRRVLSISPEAQITPVWCWAAVATMALRHFGYPNVNPAGNYQCGVVGSIGGNCAFNCGACVSAIGSSHNLANVLMNYPMVASQIRQRAFPDLDVSLDGRLEAEDIIAEIDDSRPVVAGISPSGAGQFYPPTMSEHVGLIVGYEVVGQRLHVIINDPYPYPGPQMDPYVRAGGQRLQPGRYKIDYANFVQRLGYKDSIVFR